MKNIKKISLVTLRAEVRAAWVAACKADGIRTDAKFVVFSNTTEAALYNELMGMLLREISALQQKRNLYTNVAHLGGGEFSRTVR